MYRSALLVAVCMCCWFLFASVQAQDEADNAPSLQDAKTLFDIIGYINHETGKIDNDADPKQQAALRADIFMAASGKLSEIAKDNNDRYNVYSIKHAGFRYQIDAEIEGAEQRMETFFEELAAKEETRYIVDALRFSTFIDESEKTINTPDGVEAFKSGLKTWLTWNLNHDTMSLQSRIGRAIAQVAEKHEGDNEQFVSEVIEELVQFIRSKECTLPLQKKVFAHQEFNQFLETRRFSLFSAKALATVHSPESFDSFKAELKSWINRKRGIDAVILALHYAEKWGVPVKQIPNELIEYLQSPECTAPQKDQLITEWKKLLLTAFGSDLKLYGRTLDDKDFDWDSLRGKYVLVQFTATWCGPCHLEIPGMLEAYKKFHDKGFEIVSIYIGERGEDTVASVKEHVAHKKLPWHIISETLTEKAGQPNYANSFAIWSVPTMLLVDKEGNIIMTQARGAALQTKLAEIFE